MMEIYLITVLSLFISHCYFTRMDVVSILSAAPQCFILCCRVQRNCRPVVSDNILLFILNFIHKGLIVKKLRKWPQNVFCGVFTRSSKRPANVQQLTCILNIFAGSLLDFWLIVYEHHIRLSPIYCRLLLAPYPPIRKTQPKCSRCPEASFNPDQTGSGLDDQLQRYGRLNFLGRNFWKVGRSLVIRSSVLDVTLMSYFSLIS